MNILICNKRNTRNAVVLFVVVIVLYIPLNIFFTLAGARGTSGKYKDSIPSAALHAGQPSPTKKSLKNGEISVKLKEIVPGADGNVDLVLSVNVQELLKNINSGDLNNGEATNNPVPYNPGFKIPNKDICKSSKGLKYIIYVHSSPGNTARRAHIRNTWGNKNLFKDGRTNLVFLMGIPKDTNVQQEVLNESKLYRDIVQADYRDEYKNLTIKGIAGLKWVSHYCKEAKFAIKADDDAFVHIFKLLNILDKNENHKKSVTCPLWGDNSMPILRDPAKCMKWCVKYNEFPGQAYFPKYCAGLSYAMSRDVIPEMYNHSFSTPLFWVDDVYVTGLLLGKVNNVHYESLLRNFTLKEKIALEQYSNLSQPITYYFVHIRDPTNFAKIWELTLKRLQPQELQELNDEILKPFPTLRNK